MRTAVHAQRIERLVQLAVADLWREPLPPHACDAWDLERRAALIVVHARTAAPRIESIDALITFRVLEPELVDHGRREDACVRRCHHVIRAVERAAAAAGHDAAKGFDVL